MDAIDKKILDILQIDTTLAVAEIAQKVGLSTTPCWRRIQKLEAAGVIRSRVALLDAGQRPALRYSCPSRPTSTMQRGTRDFPGR